MFPSLFSIAGRPVDTHGLFILIGVVVATVLVLREARRRGRLDQRMLLIGFGALVVAGITSRIGSGVRYLSAEPEPTLEGLFLTAGRSLLGGLVGAYVGVEVVKRLVGVRQSTGDLFAPGVAAGLAVGRIGCFLTEQLGTPTALPWGVRMNETGVERGLLCLDCGQCPTCNPATTFHPSFLYEIVFHSIAFLVLRAKRDDPAWRGRLLTRYLAAYGLFRFGVEFVRGNLVFRWGLSGSQIFILATTACSLAAWTVARRRSDRPDADRPDADRMAGPAIAR